MTRVTMLEFRRHAERTIRRVQGGERLLLTYRGRPVVRLEPVLQDEVREDDPVYALADLADSGGRTLSNAEMDGIVYGD